MLTCDWAKKGPTDGINRAVLSTVSADRAKMWNRAMQINSPTALAWSRAQPVNGQGCAVRVDKGRRELNADVGGAAWDKIVYGARAPDRPAAKGGDFVRDKLAKI